MKPAKLISRSPVLNQATDRYIKLNQSLCAITPLPVKTMILKNDKCSMDVAFIHSFIHSYTITTVKIISLLNLN